MRIAFLTSVTVAVAGSFRDAFGFAHGPLSVNEPLWLVLWGVGLMSLAASLRTKISRRRVPRTNAPTVSAVDAADPSLAETV
jgi:hypothetical protein